MVVMAASNDKNRFIVILFINFRFIFFIIEIFIYCSKTIKLLQSTHQRFSNNKPAIPIFPIFFIASKLDKQNRLFHKRPMVGGFQSSFIRLFSIFIQLQKNIF